MSSISFSISRLSVLHLHDVQIDIHQGECIGLSGPSGSGKSLLLRALADLQEHTGEICLQQKKQVDFKPCDWRKQVALLPADSQWWGDTVAEHFRSVDESGLQQLGFEKDVMSWQVSRLSSGEKQRLAFLRLLENQPQVLLLDEPTANLDAANSGVVEQMIRHYLESHKACAVYVSHDLEQLSRIADRQFKIVSGQLESV